MVVFHERVKGDFTSAGADGEDREFASEGDKTFEDQFCVGKLGLGFRNVVRGAKNPLAFAVVAQARSFQDGGKAERFYGGGGVFGVRNGREFTGWHGRLWGGSSFLRRGLRGLECVARR